MTTIASAHESSALCNELRLSNGTTLSNRIAQCAMTEHLGTGDGAPSLELIQAYRRFATSGAGLIITGNVMVNGWSLEAPGNVVIEDARHMPALRQWAASASGSEAQLLFCSYHFRADRLSVASRWPGALRMSCQHQRCR